MKTSLYCLGICLHALSSCMPRPAARDSSARPVALPPRDTARIAEYVVGAFKDSKGGLWFGTINNGVAHVSDGMLSFIDTAHGLPPNGGHGIAEARDGSLWFAGHDGVYTYNPEKDDGVKEVYRGEGRVGSDRQGNVWVSVAGRVLRQEGELGLELEVPVPKELPAAFSINPRKLVFQMEDSKGNLWFSTDGHGAFRWNIDAARAGAKDPFTRFTKEDGLCSNTPWEIIEDEQGRIWFTCIQAFQPAMTGDGGLCVLEKDGRFTTFPDRVGLHHNDLYTLFKDRAGNMWIGATGRGVYKFDGTGFTLFDRTDRPELNGGFGLQAMMQDRDGTLWCGFSGGLFRFDGHGFVHVPRGGPWR